ncbi:uncharacterized protein V1516DRAFT_703142 [Lipomyces oligophaga]|uniref:uncharacterized protein n=1 Tax=Lipomyces oligophaga TaxID=45792 RepID=UPI0034CF3111
MDTKQIQALDESDVEKMDTGSHSGLADYRREPMQIQVVTRELEDYISYFQNRDMREIEVAIAQKTYTLIETARKELKSVMIVHAYLDVFAGYVMEITQLQWREKNDDNLFHIFLKCIIHLLTYQPESCRYLNPSLVSSLTLYLFSQKKPIVSDRYYIVKFLELYISCGPSTSRTERSALILETIESTQSEGSGPDFIVKSHLRRPYKKWYEECFKISRDFYWIFRYQEATLQVLEYQTPKMVFESSQEAETYSHQLQPKEQVESVVTQYLAAHIRLINLIIVSFDSQEDRYRIRSEILRDSRFELLIGFDLRMAKQNKPSSANLKRNLEVLITLAKQDGWDTAFMQTGLGGDHYRPVGTTKNQLPPRLPQLSTFGDFSESLFELK